MSERVRLRMTMSSVIW